MSGSGLTRDEIAAIEKETEEKYGISRLILMENAGRLTAETVAERCGEIQGKKVCIVSGKGNNGGDGFVAARYLFNMGAGVKVFYCGFPGSFTSISFTNYEILCKMNIESFSLENAKSADFELKDADVVVDALFGTGVRGEVAGRPAELIAAVNESRKFIVCADIPSGLDADTGRICGTAVRGCVTVSFGFAKKGFFLNDGPEYCGDIVVKDIGFPKFFKRMDKR